MSCIFLVFLKTLWIIIYEVIFYIYIHVTHIITNTFCLTKYTCHILDNLVSWDKYERERDGLADKLAAADTELIDTKKVFSLEMGPKDHADRVKTAATMRKDIEGSFSAMVAANETLNQLLEDDVKMELGEQVGP